jgi:hypothetical protein
MSFPALGLRLSPSCGPLTPGTRRRTRESHDCSSPGIRHVQDYREGLDHVVSKGRGSA